MPKTRVQPAAGGTSTTRLVINQGRWVLDPRKSRFVKWWDFPLASALCFTAIVTPFEVSFVDPPESVDALFVVNRIIDVIFLGDLVLHFMLMYPTRSGAMHAERWVTDRRQIAWHYLTGWFAVDFINICVGLVDILMLGLLTSKGPTSVQQASSTKILRVLLRCLRAARMFKLLRLLNMPRIIKRWEQMTGDTVAFSCAPSARVHNITPNIPPNITPVPSVRCVYTSLCATRPNRCHVQAAEVRGRRRISLPLAGVPVGPPSLTSR